MKTRLGLWIASVAVIAAVAAGCGTSPDLLTNPQPTPTAVARVTPVPVPTPKATPPCTNHKMCEEGVR